MKEIMRAAEVDLVLASASPRRHDLLRGIGVRFHVMPSTIDETLVNGQPPDAQVRRLALAKARDVSRRVPNLWVLAADTIVVLGGHILGKPKDQEEAKSMLAALASRTHEVFTGYAIINASVPQKERVRSLRSEVHIRGLTPDEVSTYVSTGEPMDKAGAYAIQGIGSGIVERISGSYTNVVGLPLCEVMRDLKDLGIFNFLGGNPRP